MYFLTTATLVSYIVSCNAADFVFPDMIKDGLASLPACLTGKAYTDPTLGPIDDNATFYCSVKYPTTYRQLPGLTCCTPQTPDYMKVRFRLYLPNEGEVKDLDWRSETIDSKIIDGRINFIAHGFMETIETSPWMKQLGKAYTDLGEQVVFVDWRHANQLQYFQSVANLRVVGWMIGRMIVKWNVSLALLFLVCSFFDFRLPTELLSLVSVWVARWWVRQANTSSTMAMASKLTVASG